MQISGQDGCYSQNKQQFLWHTTTSVYAFSNGSVLIWFIPFKSQTMQKQKDKMTAQLSVKATSSKVELDFNDPSWKQKFQEDWDRRFSLPSVTDIYDLKPRPTTFSLKKNRFHLSLCLMLLSQLSFDLLNIYPTIFVCRPSAARTTSDESDTPMDMWNGYVNNDDRALLKVSIQQRFLARFIAQEQFITLK